MSSHQAAHGGAPEARSGGGQPPGKQELGTAQPALPALPESRGAGKFCGSIALAGNPNSGKTSLFNALTGLNQRVANYPGITVERKSGSTRIGSREVEVIDLPGTYSLIPTSPDEQVAMEILRGLRPGVPLPDVVVAVVDAAHLGRGLYLVSQLIELGRPLVVALTMMDVCLRRGQHIEVAALSSALGCPVVPVIARDGLGIEELRTAMASARPPTPPDHPQAPALLAAAADLAVRIDCTPEEARRLLIEDPAVDLYALAALPDVATARARHADLDPVRVEVETRYAWVDRVIARCCPTPAVRTAFTERLDRVLLHRFWGLGIFALVMALLFVSIFWLAGPMQDACQSAVSWLGDLLTGGMGDGLLRRLLRDGVFPGVGAVVVFVPQIALLFLFLALLEDSGYLARAAFLMDRLLCRVGLHGKSFIPLLSSFACAIPGILAARTIDSRRERLATVLVAPFMSCSARLPVYALLVAAFFNDWHPVAKGALMLGCYVLGILAAVVTALLVKLIAQGRGAMPFLLEMPVYQRPHAKQVGIAMWNGVREFLFRAGTIIFCLSVLLWALATFPRPTEAEIATSTMQFERTWIPAHPAATPDERKQALENHLAADALADSAAGHIGKAIEPAVQPLGFDWKIAIGLVGAFAAREVFVSTLAITYSVGGDEGALAETVRTDPDWDVVTAFSLLVWFVLAMQCISTTAVVRRESGGWKWALLQIAWMNSLAYAACLLVHQIGGRL